MISIKRKGGGVSEWKRNSQIPAFVSYWNCNGVDGINSKTNQIL